MNINYDHAKNCHTLKGPLTALPLIFPKGIPKSILDIGCGTGTWLRAAKELGNAEVLGIDGVNIPKKQLLIELKDFQKHDLKKPIFLNKKFDAVFCLEVAEHLHKKYAHILIRTLTRHSDLILFSAACPNQGGQNHINCQWPSYWQKKFNKQGFACYDSIRSEIWNEESIEPWYRQNIFVAKKSKKAGNEKKLISVMHPKLFKPAKNQDQKVICSVERGSQPFIWYFCLLFKVLTSKLKRKINNV